MVLLDTIAEHGGRSGFQSLRFALGLSPSSLNGHLHKLEGAGLIRIEKGYSGSSHDPELGDSVTYVGPWETTA